MKKSNKKSKSTTDDFMNMVNSSKSTKKNKKVNDSKLSFYNSLTDKQKKDFDSLYKNKGKEKMSLGGLFSGEDEVGTTNAAGETMLFSTDDLSKKQMKNYQDMSFEEQTQYQQDLQNKEGAVNPEDEGAILDAVGDLFGINVNELIGGISSGIKTMGGDGGEDSDVGEGIVELISPELADTIWSGEHKRETRKAEMENLSKTAYLKKRNDNKFADGGPIDEDNPELKLLKSIVSGVDTDDPEKKLATSKQEKIIPEGYHEQLLSYDLQKKQKEAGTNPKLIKDDPKLIATKKDRIPRKQTKSQTKFIAETVYGISPEEFDKRYEENPEAFLNELLKLEMKDVTGNDQGYRNDDVYSIDQDSNKNFVFSRDVLDTKSREEFKDGGEIVGEGTGKSDSIDAELPPGSFIVPADAPEAAVSRLKKYMNYDEANLDYSSGKSVSVSDGELFIPPEDVQKANAFIQRLGYDGGLDEMAPNAKKKLSDNPGYADGGFLEENAGTIGGAAQLLLSAIESGKNEQPKSDTEQLLKDLSRETRTRAAYGLNPFERTQAENSIERSLNSEREIIKNFSGGSLDVFMNNNAAAVGRANEAKLGLEVASSKIQEDKERYSDSITMKAIAANEAEFDRTYQQYAAGEENIATLTQAGISNIIGQSQFNKQSSIFQDEKEKDRNVNMPDKKEQKEKNPKENIFEDVVNPNTNFFTKTDSLKGV